MYNLMAMHKLSKLNMVSSSILQLSSSNHIHIMAWPLAKYCTWKCDPSSPIFQCSFIFRDQRNTLINFLIFEVFPSLYRLFDLQFLTIDAFFSFIFSYLPHNLRRNPFCWEFLFFYVSFYLSYNFHILKIGASFF